MPLDYRKGLFRLWFLIWAVSAFVIFLMSGWGFVGFKFVAISSAAIWTLWTLLIWIAAGFGKVAPPNFTGLVAVLLLAAGKQGADQRQHAVRLSLGTPRPDRRVELVDVATGHGLHKMTTQHGQNIPLQDPAILIGGFLLRSVVAQKAFRKVRNGGRGEAFETLLCGIFAFEDTRRVATALSFALATA